MDSLKFFLLLGVCWCMLISISEGAPLELSSFRSVEGYIAPPVESSNGTTSTGSHAGKRFIDDSRACREIYVRLNPQNYFGTADTFIPEFVYTIKCEGNPSAPPSCGATMCGMRCLTRMGNVEFRRIPQGNALLQCLMQRPVVIPDVPIGCYCV